MEYFQNSTARKNRCLHSGNRTAAHAAAGNFSKRGRTSCFCDCPCPAESRRNNTRRRSTNPMRLVIRKSDTTRTVAEFFRLCRWSNQQRLSGSCWRSDRMTPKPLWKKWRIKSMRLRIFSDENDKINLSLPERGRSTAVGFTIHIICRLPKGQPPQLYCCRSTQNRRRLSMNTWIACTWRQSETVPVVEHSVLSEQICRFRCAMMGQFPLCWILTKL